MFSFSRVNIRAFKLQQQQKLMEGVLRLATASKNRERGRESGTKRQVRLFQGEPFLLLYEDIKAVYY